jgi:hypothetical protein
MGVRGGQVTDKLSVACSVQRELQEDGGDDAAGGSGGDDDGAPEPPADGGGVSYVVTAGASYEISDKVFLISDSDKDEHIRGAAERRGSISAALQRGEAAYPRRCREARQHIRGAAERRGSISAALRLAPRADEARARGPRAVRRAACVDV